MISFRGVAILFKALGANFGLVIRSSTDLTAILLLYFTEQYAYIKWPLKPDAFGGRGLVSVFLVSIWCYYIIIMLFIEEEQAAGPHSTMHYEQLRHSFGTREKNTDIANFILSFLTSIGVYPLLEFLWCLKDNHRILLVWQLKCCHYNRTEKTQRPLQSLSESVTFCGWKTCSSHRNTFQRSIANYFYHQNHLISYTTLVIFLLIRDKVKKAKKLQHPGFLFIRHKHLIRGAQTMPSGKAVSKF